MERISSSIDTAHTLLYRCADKAMNYSFKLLASFFPLEWLAERDSHFCEKKIVETCGRRMVRGHRKMVMLNGNSYLGLLNCPHIIAVAPPNASWCAGRNGRHSCAEERRMPRAVSRTRPQFAIFP